MGVGRRGESSCPRSEPRKGTCPQQPVPQIRSPSWTGGAGLPFLRARPQSPPAARLFRSWECGGGPRGPPTARQAGAPGGEAVAFCSRSRETPGRPEFPPGAPGGRLGAGSIVAAALDGAGVLHGGLGPCSLPRPPPVRTWSTTPLLPSGVGTRWAGEGAVLLLQHWVLFPSLVPAPAPCRVCQTPCPALGGFPWAGVFSWGAAVPPCPEVPAQPPRRPLQLPSPPQRKPRDFCLPGHQQANTRIFNLGLSAIMVLFDASLATWPLMRDCAFPRQL